MEKSATPNGERVSFQSFDQLCNENNVLFSPILQVDGDFPTGVLPKKHQNIIERKIEQPQFLSRNSHFWN